MTSLRSFRFRIAAMLAVAALSSPLTAGAVDGVILITQARALAGGVTPGDLPGFPVTISESGSYRLASDLRVPTADIAAVDLRTAHITLDLNGFTVFGPGKGVGTAAGIDGHPGEFVTGDVVVMNGSVRNMGGHGIALDAASTVERVNSVNNGLDGMILTTGARIMGCEANGNGNNGFRILRGQVAHSNATANGQSGVYVEAGVGLVSDNVLERNGTWGIFAVGPGPDASTGYKGNALIGNLSGPASGAVVQLGPNLCAGTTTCP